MAGRCVGRWPGGSDRAPSPAAGSTGSPPWREVPLALGEAPPIRGFLPGRPHQPCPPTAPPESGRVGGRPQVEAAPGGGDSGRSCLLPSAGGGEALFFWKPHLFLPLLTPRMEGEGETLVPSWPALLEPGPLPRSPARRSREPRLEVTFSPDASRLAGSGSAKSRARETALLPGDSSAPTALGVWILLGLRALGASAWGPAPSAHRTPRVQMTSGTGMPRAQD